MHQHATGLCWEGRRLQPSAWPAGTVTLGNHSGPLGILYDIWLKHTVVVQVLGSQLLTVARAMRTAASLLTLGSTRAGLGEVRAAGSCGFFLGTPAESP